jgi:addiction module RelE/StbE family toxin
MLRVIWSNEARMDMRDILAYIAKRDVAASKRLRQTITNSVLNTLDNPSMYRTGRVVGTREIVAHPNYIVVYRIREGVIDVLRVLHSRQQYP